MVVNMRDIPFPQIFFVQHIISNELIIHATNQIKSPGITVNNMVANSFSKGVPSAHFFLTAGKVHGKYFSRICYNQYIGAGKILYCFWSG